MSPSIIHADKAHGELLDRLRIVAESQAEVLLTGPSGVGKELYASFIHANSPRVDRHFVVINCANLSDDMLESEVFGHSRGAFTGAIAVRQGIAAAADGGTLFLDEIDSLSLSCQAKVLRFVQFKEYRRLGENHTRRSNFRLIAAASSDLVERVRNGSFREDLYFRLRVVPVDIPPLVDRPADLIPLLDHFVAKYAEDYRTGPIEFTEAAIEHLKRYHWPGNVRELENCVRYLTCLKLGRPVELTDLELTEPVGPSPRQRAFETPSALPLTNATADPVAGLLNLPFNEAKSAVVEEFERTYLDSALIEAEGNVARAARKSCKHRRAFFELMKRYGMSGRNYRG